MQEKLAGIEAAVEGGSRGGADSSAAGGPTRRPLQSARKRNGPPADHAAGRGVSFSPETRDIERTPRLTRQPTPYHRGGPRRATGGGGAGGTGWMPYLMVAFVICMGPARPLLYSLLSELFGSLFGEASLLGGGEPKEVPWYDSE